MVPRGLIDSIKRRDQVKCSKSNAALLKKQMFSYEAGGDQKQPKQEWTPQL